MSSMLATVPVSMAHLQTVDILNKHYHIWDLYIYQRFLPYVNEHTRMYMILQRHSQRRAITFADPKTN